jgi:hypothetical protein
MVAAVGRLLPPWETLGDHPEVSRTESCHFPYLEPCLNKAIINEEAIKFARQWRSPTTDNRSG